LGTAIIYITRMPTCVSVRWTPDLLQ